MMGKNALMRHRNRLSRLRTPEEGGGGGSAGGDPKGGQGGAGGDGGGSGEKYTPPATQADLDRIITERVQRERAKYRDYDTHKAKSEQYDILAAASQTDAERAAAEAREAGYQEGMGTAVPKAVRAEFKAQAKDVGLTKDQVASLLEDLDLTKYATDDGDPDEEKIGKKLAALVPAGGKGGTRPPNFGQGNGHQQSTVRKGEAGIAEAQRRFPTKS